MGKIVTENRQLKVSVANTLTADCYSTCFPILRRGRLKIETVKYITIHLKLKTVPPQTRLSIVILLKRGQRKQRLFIIYTLSRLQLPLTLRQRRDGDRFHPFGMRGTKKVKDLLIDAKIPQQERGRVPVLMNGDEIIWVVGYRMSEPFKIRPETKRRLYLSYSTCTKINENGN